MTFWQFSEINLKIVVIFENIWHLGKYSENLFKYFDFFENFQKSIWNFFHFWKCLENVWNIFITWYFRKFLTFLKIIKNNFDIFEKYLTFLTIFRNNFNIVDNFEEIFDISEKFRKLFWIFLTFWQFLEIIYKNCWYFWKFLENFYK